MSNDYLAFFSKKKRMIKSMESLEKTFATYQNLQRLNLVANALAEIAQGDPRLLSMIVVKKHSPQELLDYADIHHADHPAWSYLIMHHQILMKRELDNSTVFTAFQLDAEVLGLNNNEHFKEMLLSMATSRPDLSGKKNLYVTFSGGGAKGFGHIGVLECLEDHDLYDKVETVAGTSAGGLIAALAALGYRPREINKLVHEKDFSGFIYEFKSVLSKIAHAISPLTSNHRMLRNVAFLDEFTKAMAPELAAYLMANDGLSDWDKNLLLKAKEIGQRELVGALTDLLTTRYSQEDLLLIIDKMDKRWMSDMTAKCTEMAEVSLGVQRPEDNTNNPWYRLTKRTLSNMWYGMSPYIKFKNPRDAISTALNIMTKRDTVQAFMGRIVYEKVKSLADKCVNDPAKRKLFTEAMFEGHYLRENEEEWPVITHTVMANVTLRQLDRLRERFPEEGFKKLILTFCERDGTILNKNNITAVNADANSEKYANMRLVDAMCATMRLPVVFSPYVIEQPISLTAMQAPEQARSSELERYVDPNNDQAIGYNPVMIKLADGGLLQNFPMKSLEDIVPEPRQVVGFYLAPEQNFLAAEHANELANPLNAVEVPGQNALISFIRNAKQGLTYFRERIHGDKQVSKYQLSTDQQIRVGAINVKEVGTVDFNMNSAEKSKLIEAGYNTAERLIRQQTAGRVYDINTAFWAEKFMAKITQFEKAGLVQELKTPELQNRWELITKMKGRVGTTTPQGLSL
ncbi:MAG: patatin-like phospholipase family protein [Hafnia sp.]